MGKILGGGSTSVSVPPPTAEERALQAEQAAVLRQQRDILSEQLRQQNLLSPILFERAGLKPIFGEARPAQERVPLDPSFAPSGPSDTPSSGNNFFGFGSRDAANAAGVRTGADYSRYVAAANDPLAGQAPIIGFETIDDPDAALLQDLERRFLQSSLAQLEAADDLAPQRQAIERGLLQRAQDALEGKLELDPSLTRELTDERERLVDQLRRQLGPGFETSTPGIQALAEFDKRAAEVREGARRGQLTLAEQLGLARGANNQANLGQILGLGADTGSLQESRINSLFSRGAGITNLTNPAAFGQLAAGFGAAQQPFIAQRGLEFQAAIQSAQARQQAQQSLFGGLGGLAGTLGSSAILSGSKFGPGFLAAGLPSSRDFKHKSGGAEGVLDKVETLDIDRWRYTEETQGALGTDGNEHVGPYAEDFSEAFGVGDGKTINPLDGVGVALKAVQELTERVRELEAQLQ